MYLSNLNLLKKYLAHNNIYDVYDVAQYSQNVGHPCFTAFR